MVLHRFLYEYKMWLHLKKNLRNGLILQDNLAQPGYSIQLEIFEKPTFFYLWGVGGIIWANAETRFIA